MQREVKIGLGVAAVGLAVFAIVRFGSGPAAKTGLDLALANLPPGWSATHGAVSYSALSGDARVDNLVVTHNDIIVFSAASVLASGITGVTPTAPPRHIGHLIIKDASATFLKHMGRLSFDGIEIENIRKLFDPAFYPGGKPASDARLVVVESSDASDLALHVDGSYLPRPRHGQKPLMAVDLHIAEIHGGAVMARQFPSPPTAASLQDGEFLASATRGVAYGPTSVKDITEILPDVGEIRIGSESVSAVQDGRLGSITVNQMAFTANVPGASGSGHISADRLAARNVDFSRVFDVLPAVMADPAQNGHLLSPAIHIGSYELGGVIVDFSKSPLMSVASFSGSGAYAADGTQTGSATLRGLKIVTTGRDINPATALMLQRFGMADFNVDFDEAGRFFPPSARLKLTQADVTLHGLGALHLTADLAGLSGGGTTPMDQLAMLRSMKLYSASLRWDDASLTDRIFHLLSQQRGKTEAALRAELVMPVTALGFMMSEQPDAARQVNAFLDGRHRLTITLAPPRPPVTLADLIAAGAAEKAPLLGVTIKGD